MERKERFPNVKPGLIGRSTLVVSESTIASHVRVMSTPALVSQFERAALNAIRERLPEGYTSVGYLVNIRHLGPVPIGGEMSAIAEVTDVVRNHVHFSLLAYYGEKKVGDGTHIQVIVPKTFGGQNKA